jgi:16S rRNA (cytidine1402-2'-O)-methyltransferase
MTVKGKLYLIPSPIAADTASRVIPSSVAEDLKHIRFFLAEDIRTARRFLGSLRIYRSVEELDFQLLNKDTTEEEVATYFGPLLEGHDMGVISEAGCPGVADPGALAVSYAHRHDIRVVPLVGPSSLIMALMASGLNGQQFAFHGYLPIDQQEAGRKIRELERESRARNQTQIFIETPHRNNSVFSMLMRNLSPATSLTIALDITGGEEFIRTQAVSAWNSETPSWPKFPAVFLFLA